MEQTLATLERDYRDKEYNLLRRIDEISLDKKRASYENQDL